MPPRCHRRSTGRGRRSPNPIPVPSCLGPRSGSSGSPRGSALTVRPDDPFPGQHHRGAAHPCRDPSPGPQPPHRDPQRSIGLRASAERWSCRIHLRRPEPALMGDAPRMLATQNPSPRSRQCGSSPDGPLPWLRERPGPAPTEQVLRPPEARSAPEAPSAASAPWDSVCWWVHQWADRRAESSSRGRTCSTAPQWLSAQVASSWSPMAVSARSKGSSTTWWERWSTQDSALWAWWRPRSSRIRPCGHASAPRPCRRADGRGTLLLGSFLGVGQGRRGG